MYVFQSFFLFFPIAVNVLKREYDYWDRNKMFSVFLYPLTKLPISVFICDSLLLSMNKSISRRFSFDRTSFFTKILHTKSKIKSIDVIRNPYLIKATFCQFLFPWIMLILFNREVRLKFCYYFTQKWQKRFWFWLRWIYHLFNYKSHN
jgi:hypothetical protein